MYSDISLYSKQYAETCFFIPSQGILVEILCELGYLIIGSDNHLFTL